jgi:K+-sensing histidine kinase KdpD
VAVRVMQVILMSRWSTCAMSCEHIMRTVWYRFSYVVPLAIASLMLESCAELSEFRMDIARLRSDLQANTQALSQLSARVDELERRQADAESAARQTQQNLTQAIEVLLRKAPMTRDRQITRESGKSPAKDPKKLDSEARQHSLMGQRTSSRGEDSHQGRKQLSLGMTQEDVRRMLGNPTSIEPVGPYIFWHYSPMSNQEYVIFDKMSGQVSGWRGP